MAIPASVVMDSVGSKLAAMIEMVNSDHLAGAGISGTPPREV